MLHGCEIWTISVEEQKKIKVFEIWYYRKMLKISWTERITNEEELNKISKRRSL